MEPNTQEFNQTQIPTPPVEPVQKMETVEPKKSGGFIIVLLSILLIISVLIAGFFAYQTQNLVKEITKLQIAPTPIESIEPSPTADLTANWKTYTASNGLFSFNYPDADWNISEYTSPNGHMQISVQCKTCTNIENVYLFIVQQQYSSIEEYKQSSTYSFTIDHMQTTFLGRDADISLQKGTSQSPTCLKIFTANNGKGYELTQCYYQSLVTIQKTEQLPKPNPDILTTFKFVGPITSPQPSPLTN